MSKTKETPEKEYTAEEIAAAQVQRTEFYNSNLPVLRLQKEYEELLALIEESRLRRLNAIMRYAQLTTAPDPEEAKQPERKLKN
jgi:hypothetical protein